MYRCQIPRTISCGGDFAVNVTGADVDVVVAELEAAFGTSLGAWEEADEAGGAGEVEATRRLGAIV